MSQYGAYDVNLDDSDDDIAPGSKAHHLLAHMSSATSHLQKLLKATAKDALQYQGGSVAHAARSAGLLTPFDTTPYENALRNQVGIVIGARHNEIEAQEQALSTALMELRRARQAEEARLADKVAAATQQFEGQLMTLQQAFMKEVEKLKRQAIDQINQARADSEAAIGSRMRALQGQLRYERPATVSNPGGGNRAAEIGARLARSAGGFGIGLRSGAATPAYIAGTPRERGSGGGGGGGSKASPAMRHRSPATAMMDTPRSRQQQQRSPPRSAIAARGKGAAFSPAGRSSFSFAHGTTHRGSDESGSDGFEY